ncbi:MAG: hypothetical protein ACC657_07590, partial [Thiohalomonadales bacterium]
ATTDAGAVYVFSRATTTSATSWAQQSYIKSSDRINPTNPAYPKPQDYFGFSLALSGDGSSLIVGAYGIDEIPNITIDSGGAFLFTNDGKGVWSQKIRITAFDTQMLYRFGWSVAINDNGTIMVVGATSATFKRGNVAGGKAYLYQTGLTGGFASRILFGASNPNDSDNFSVVSISGDGRTLAIGASGDNGNSKGINNALNNFAANAGAVYRVDIVLDQKTGTIFLNSQSYTYIKASNTDIDDLFGSAVALSVDGSTLAVGAPGEAGAATGGTSSNIIPDTLNAAAGAGAIYLY